MHAEVVDMPPQDKLTGCRSRKTSETCLGPGPNCDEGCIWWSKEANRAQGHCICLDDYDDEPADDRLKGAPISRTARAKLEARVCVDSTEALKRPGLRRSENAPHKLDIDAPKLHSSTA
jgi:hypothetical protein